MKGLPTTTSDQKSGSRHHALLTGSPKKTKRGKRSEDLKLNSSLAGSRLPTEKCLKNKETRPCFLGLKRNSQNKIYPFRPTRSNISDINFEDRSLTISCKKRPKDTAARIGVRRNTKNPNKKEKIFGYNLVLSRPLNIWGKWQIGPLAKKCDKNCHRISDFGPVPRFVL